MATYAMRRTEGGWEVYRRDLGGAVRIGTVDGRAPSLAIPAADYLDRNPGGPAGPTAGPRVNVPRVGLAGVRPDPRVTPLAWHLPVANSPPVRVGC